jgi:hypothetical protein
MGEHWLDDATERYGGMTRIMGKIHIIWIDTNIDGGVMVRIVYINV